MKLFFLSILLAGICSISSAQSQADGTELQAMSYQIGKWLATTIQKTKEGMQYQFGYELQWFDKKKTIAKMVITRVFESGEIEMLWEGFKNWDPRDKKIYYAGCNAQGIIAKGEISFQGENIIEANYSGFSPQGLVQIRDVATRVDDTHYTNVTNMKMPNADWRVANTDNWVKVEEQKFSDKLK